MLVFEFANAVKIAVGALTFPYRKVSGFCPLSTCSVDMALCFTLHVRLERREPNLLHLHLDPVRIAVIPTYRLNRTADDNGHGYSR